MKNNTLLYASATVLLSAGLMFTACKKDKTVQNPAVTTETGQSSADNRDVQNENDAALSDMNGAIADQSNLRGRSAGTSGASAITGTVCGLSVDTAGMSTTGSIKLNYSGITCNNRTRTGAIRISLQDYNAGKRWKDANCTIKIEYLDYKVTRASDQKSMKFNGVQYIKNESGGTWWELLFIKTQSSLVSSITGTDLRVTFNDNKTAVYNINRRITYTFPGGILFCKAEGIGASGGLGNLENYGTTRNGDAFTSQVNTPLLWNSTCGSGAPLQGDVLIKVATQNFQLHGTFGVDANGTVVSSGANTCPYGWKLSWTENGQVNTKIFGYL